MPQKTEQEVGHDVVDLLKESGLGPEQALSLLAALLATTAKAITDQHGKVIVFVGDECEVLVSADAASDETMNAKMCSNLAEIPTMVAARDALDKMMDTLPDEIKEWLKAAQLADSQGDAEAEPTVH